VLSFHFPVIEHNKRKPQKAFFSRLLSCFTRASLSAPELFFYSIVIDVVHDVVVVVVLE